MKVRIVVLTILMLVIAVGASAQATRTWVSGVGDDANPCSRTAPCKTFAGAISKTAAGGEIDNLDSGGFGAVNITKSITIDGSESGQASILNSGTNGLIINAGSTGVVTIRNININGAGTTLGLNGIRVLTAKAVHLENVTIFGQSGRGISVENTSGLVQLFLRNVIVRNNNGDGITTIPAGGTVRIYIENSYIAQNGQNGIQLNNNTKGAFFSTAITGNNQGVLLNTSTNTLEMIGCTISLNQTGLQNGIVGQAPTTRMSKSLIAGNIGAGVTINGGTVNGFGDNAVAGNGSGNAITAPPLAQQ